MMRRIVTAIRWGILLTAAALLGVAAPVHAQTKAVRGSQPQIDPLALAAALATAPGAVAVPVRRAGPLPLEFEEAAATLALAAAAVSPSTPALPAPGPGGPADAGAALVASSATGAVSSAAPAVAPAGRPLGAGFAPDATRVVPAGVASALGDFVREQLSSPRVKVARTVAEEPLKEAFERAGVPWPSARIYLRAFKREHQLEVWGQRTDGTYALVKTYPICSLGRSGLGPKVRKGDEQVPEGFYHVVQFNPSSEYHLSLRLDYPNAADLARASAAGAAGDGLGGDIYLHGGCRSAGCLPLTDAGIEQIYWLSVQARANGERQIPIDIFPARLDVANWSELSTAFAGKPALLTFWAQLKRGYDAFERTHRLPDVAIDVHGQYVVALMGR